MYERSAIVLERNYNSIFGFNKKVNLKTIYKDFKDLVEEIQKYQLILKEEDKVINEFDEVANEIRNIQQEQKRIYKYNIKFEEERNQLFDSLDEEPNIIEKNMKKIEENININNKRLEELREEFVNSLTNFSEKQKERNKYSRSRRAEERIHLQLIEKTNNDMNDIDDDVLKNMKIFIASENENEKKEIIEVMINNGKDERIAFNKNVIENAVNVRNEIAKKEAECYIMVYERIKRLLLEVNADEIKLDKYEKTLRDISVKLSFLKAQNNYIVSFLDNERMTAINGLKVHKQLMLDACKDFELDMEQFENLYELILKEISGKATKKLYKELYNKEYLKKIEEKERRFEKEINSIKINAGTIINSSYWRIEEIKNIYEVFQNEVSEKFEKDLSEFKLEEVEEINLYEEEKFEMEDDIFKTEISDDNVEYVEEYEYDEDYEDYEYDDNEDDYEDDEYDDEVDEEFDDDEYEEDDEEEYNEYDDEEEYDEYDDEEVYYEYDDEVDEEYEEEYDEYDDEDDEEDDDEIDEEYGRPRKDKKGKGLLNKFFKG